MPVIVKTLTVADGDVLTADQLAKLSWQAGREANFDGANGGGSEVVNGQMDLKNIDGDGTLDPVLTRRHVRRGAFTQGPHVSGFRMSRDVWSGLFPDLNPLATPQGHERAVGVLGRTWQSRDNVHTLWIDVSLDYTVEAAQLFTDDPDITDAQIGGNLALYLDDVLITGSYTPLGVGRSSTVKPLTTDHDYNNTGAAPDFRHFHIQLRVTQEQVVGWGLDPATMLAGWHDVSLRVSGNKTIRLHGGHFIVIPIV